MNRRTYLGAGVAGTLSAVAGCLDSLGAIPGAGGTSPSDDGPEPAEGAVLGPPDREHDISASIHPTYGDEIPSYSVPDALSGESISDTDFRGERAQLYTFVYTNCLMGACPALLQRLVTVNLAVREAGHRDDAAFTPFTFDPKRDTPEVLRDYADKFNIDPAADDWYFLRPESQEAAYDLLLTAKSDGGFGLPIEEKDADELAEEGTETDLEYAFTHYALILLVNDRGIVERSYPNATGVEPSRIEEDMLAVLEG